MTTAVTEIILLQKSHRNPVTQIWTERLGAPNDYIDTWLTAVIETPQTVGVVVEMNGTVAGFGVACTATEGYINDYINHPEIHVDAWETTGLIHVVAVKRGVEGNGVGTSIVHSLTRLVKSVGSGGVVAVSWHRDNHRDSRSLFDSYGFDCVESRDEFYREINDNPHCVDCECECGCGGSIFKLSFDNP